MVWLHASSDAVTALAYYSIPAVLLVFARKRAEGRVRWVLLLFAAFVLACGTTHLTSLITLWVPIYFEQGIVKVVTATISLATAAVLWPLLPYALKAPTRNELGRLVNERTAELHKAMHAAERANAAKSRFLAAASHDLRQPFQAMELYREVLDARLTAPKDREALMALSGAMAAGKELLNALLDISTLEAGITVPKIERVELGPFLTELVGEFHEEAERNTLGLTLAVTSAVVQTDRLMLARIVRNLISNALRYTQSGRILVGCRRVKGFIRIEIWDTGPGIPPERQAEIWEEFTQLGNPERDRSKGLGLGLAIVAKQAKLLAHPVGVRSREGRGSVFFVELPRAA